MKIKNYYTITEYADLIEADRDTVFDWVKKGDLKADQHTKRGRWLIPYLEIPTFIRQRMENQKLSNIGETEEMKGEAK